MAEEKGLLSERLRAHLPFALAGLVVAILGTALREAAKEVAPPFIASVLPALKKETLSWICVGFFSSSVMLGIWILFLLFENKTKNVQKKYKFVSSTGYYIRRKTGERFCGNCLSSKGGGVSLTGHIE
jgi:hypothetical protein